MSGVAKAGGGSSGTIDERPRDVAWMRQALALASLGEGATAPNPNVGCVVVRDGEVVGTGWHRRAGAEHAEFEALARAGARAEGAELYVNLEPCAHSGRTPPCVDRIVAAGVRRVVAAIADPNPHVDGRGFARLREAGVEVAVGAAAAEARTLNAAFLTRHRRGRPWVTLKWAASLDGRTAGGKSSRWITGEAARRYAHRVRLRHDAVLVGAGTLLDDDPRLTVRLPGVAPPAAGPTRVVLAGRRPWSGSRQVLDGAVRTLVYRPRGAGPRPEGLPSSVEVVDVESSSRGVRVADVVHDLAVREIRSVLVEGGAAVAGSCLEEGVVDEIVAFRAPVLLGARGGGRPIAAAFAAASPDRARAPHPIARTVLGSDDVAVYLTAQGAACLRD